MEGKTIFKVLGGTAVLLTLFAFKKKNDFSKVLEEMTLDVRNIRNLRMNGAKLLADVDLGFHNPTKYDMTILTAGLIKLKQIKLFYKRVQIGSALSLNGLDTFELPAKSNYLITDITMELKLFSIADQWINNGMDANMNNYTAHITVEALGKSWVIEQ
ncbi:hypothetical protein [Flavobacterium fluviatile]|uniref:hypothetical protein n=1 Tax=Flavobacterium fluviatile TaxID=1862387 RepID=UPI0013D4AF08|nr:hypothetical protein [Flavobacterium fluviatile]